MEIGEAAETNKKLGHLLDTDIAVCNTCNIQLYKWCYGAISLTYFAV
jgi:hypothetical protein